MLQYYEQKLKRLLTARVIKETVLKGVKNAIKLALFS